MRALQKEPDQRYQSCREMLKTCEATGPLGRVAAIRIDNGNGGGSPTATLVSANTGGQGIGGEDPVISAMARSLISRTSAPGPNAGHPPDRCDRAVKEAPKKKSSLGRFSRHCCFWESLFTRE